MGPRGWVIAGSRHTVEYLCPESQHQSRERRSRPFPGEEGRGDLVRRPALGGEEMGHLETAPAGRRYHPNLVRSSYNKGRQEGMRETRKRDLPLLPRSPTDEDRVSR